MVCIYKKKSTRHLISENSIYTANIDVIQKNMSIRAASSKHGIKKTTHHQRIERIRKTIDDTSTGIDTSPIYKYHSKFAHNQVFTKEQEGYLAEYIKMVVTIQYGMSYAQVRRFAYTYSQHLGVKCPDTWTFNQCAGSDWMKSFLKRHIDINLGKLVNTRLGKATSFNSTSVNEFFDSFERVLGGLPIGPDRIFNLNETGIITVLGSEASDDISDAQEQLITLSVIINAAGQTLPPIFIFPRKKFNLSLLNGAPVGSHGLANLSGWMTGELFLEVCKHIQVHTNCSPENPILIVLDNHESHATLDVILYCKENGIHFVTFPPHCAHKLQPLDVALFGPFKTFCKKAYDDWKVSNKGAKLDINDVVGIITSGYGSAFTVSNILDAFAVTGIWPIARSVYTDKDFLNTGLVGQNETTFLHLP